MAKQERFWTGLITIGDEGDGVSHSLIGSGWKVKFEYQREKPSSVHDGREVVVYAKNWYSAQRTLDLIEGCHEVLLGNPPIFPMHLVAHNKTEPSWMNQDERQALSEGNYCITGFPRACSIAKKATRRRKWIYAIAKYRFSTSLFAIHGADLEPFRSPNLPISQFPRDHITFSHAIISAYSAIEELGLEIRASSQRPSRINGQWNPIVKQELESRLQNAGVNLSETILWTMRGPKRRIEKKRPVPAKGKATWSAWTVRDSELHISDAIAYADWLRDCVASHSVKHLTRGLSPYDVVNVQHLARRLILESLGYWRHF
jgi:hypothetical protein